MDTDEFDKLADNALKATQSALNLPIAAAIMAGTVAQVAMIIRWRKDLDPSARRQLVIDTVKKNVEEYKKRLPDMKDIFDDMVAALERRPNMPCTQCEESGKWKWGETGVCEYDSKEACEAAHEGEHE